LFAVDGGDGAFPAREGFFEVELDGDDDVVVDAFEGGVFFLFKGVSVGAGLGYYGGGGTSVIMKWRSWVPPSPSWSPTPLNFILVPAL